MQLITWHGNPDDNRRDAISTQPADGLRSSMATRLPTLAFVFALMPIAMSCADDSFPVDFAATPSPSVPEDQSDSVMREIVQIRKRLGLDLFQGTSLEPVPQESPHNPEFSDLLRRVAEKSRPARSVSTTVPWDVAPVPSESFDDVEEPFSESLLQASWNLDQRAHQLDRQRQYQRADQLRRLARRLRREARSEDRF